MEVGRSRVWVPGLDEVPPGHSVRCQSFAIHPGDVCFSISDYLNANMLGIRKEKERGQWIRGSYC